MSGLAALTLRALVWSYRCTYCGAGVGQLCRSRNGLAVTAWAHADRWELARYLREQGQQHEQVRGEGRC